MSEGMPNLHLEKRESRSANMEKLEDLQAKLASIMEILKRNDNSATEEDRALLRELLPVAAKLQQKRFEQQEEEKRNRKVA